MKNNDKNPKYIPDSLHTPLAQYSHGRMVDWTTTARRTTVTGTNLISLIMITTHVKQSAASKTWNLLVLFHINLLFLFIVI